MLGNIYAPFSLGFHLFFCIVATIFYAYLFKRRHYKHYLYLIFAIDFTLISQFVPIGRVIFCLGILEVIFLILIFTSMAQVSIKMKKLDKRNMELKKERALNLKNEKEEIDNAFSDDN